MNIEKLKSTWEKSKGPKKNQDELREMTKLNNHPSLRRMRIRLIVESFGVAMFLGFYHDMLDGGHKPLWLNGILILSIVLLIVVDMIGYLTLLNPVQGNDIAKSLTNLELKLKRIMVLSLATSFAFAVSLILFFTNGIHFTGSKYALLTGIIITLCALTYISFKTWSARLCQVQQSASEFNTLHGTT